MSTFVEQKKNYHPSFKHESDKQEFIDDDVTVIKRLYGPRKFLNGSCETRFTKIGASSKFSIGYCYGCFNETQTFLKLERLSESKRYVVNNYEVPCCNISCKLLILFKLSFI